MKVCLAPIGLEDVLAEELGSQVLDRRERLFFCEDNVPCHWAQNIWLDAQTHKFASVSEAAKFLRGIQRNWWLHSTAHHRRASLIQDKLPFFRPKPIAFPAQLPAAPLGSWTLMDEGTLLYAARCASPFADGEVKFIENKVDPPSRAYLKLWEFFTLVGKRPLPGERVLDLGSSPGGWTWVLDQLGANTVSVDRAGLAPHLKLSNRVEFRTANAFTLEPSDIGRVDWLFSDVICYPEKLLELVHKWKDIADNMVCTIKFQGPTRHDLVEEFLKIPNSAVRHLYHNKHELTWCKLV